jgi:hypothetical protein
VVMKLSIYSSGGRLCPHVISNGEREIYPGPNVAHSAAMVYSDAALPGQ